VRTSINNKNNTDGVIGCPYFLWSIMEPIDKHSDGMEYWDPVGRGARGRSPPPSCISKEFHTVKNKIIAHWLHLIPISNISHLFLISQNIKPR